MKQFVNAFPGVRHTVIYTDIDGKHFRFSDGTWTWRNHNPGNLRPGKISRRHNQIGETYNFAIFPDVESGHNALLDLLSSVYANYSIDRMIMKFAPPKENPTKKYAKLIHEKTGVYDDRPIKKFTAEQFEKLWKAIQQMEGYKVGKIVEVFRVTGVQTIDKHTYKFCLNEGDWISESQCVSLAGQGKVELEVCVSDLGNKFLRSPANSIFQTRPEDLKQTP